MSASPVPTDALMRELRDLVGRARSGSLPPHVGLVAFGKVTNRPWVSTVASKHDHSSPQRCRATTENRLLQEPEKL
jgi:hypothetical protein